MQVIVTSQKHSQPSTDFINIFQLTSRYQKSRHQKCRLQNPTSLLSTPKWSWCAVTTVGQSFILKALDQPTCTYVQRKNRDDWGYLTTTTITCLTAIQKWLKLPLTSTTPPPPDVQIWLIMLPRQQHQLARLLFKN